MRSLWNCLKAGSSAQKYETPCDGLRTFVGVGYPKVGNTWLRITLGKYLQKVYRLSDMPLMDIAEFPLLASAGCKAVGEFTHFPLDWTSQRADDLSAKNVVLPFRNQRVVLLVRNPLDVLVSQYMQERFRNEVAPFSGSLVDFIEHPVFGIDKLVKFYRLWAAAHDVVAAMYIWRYEDARSEPVVYFKKLLQFLGEPIQVDALGESVEFASFENLSAMERTGKTDIVYKSSGLYVFGSVADGNPNAMHVRKGQVGGYRDELPSEDAARFEARVRSGMPSLFGYS